LVLRLFGDRDSLRHTGRMSPATKQALSTEDTSVKFVVGKHTEEKPKQRARNISPARSVRSDQRRIAIGGHAENKSRPPPSVRRTFRNIVTTSRTHRCHCGDRCLHAVPDLYVNCPGGWEKTVGGKHEAARKNQGSNPRLDFVLLLP
jgi:hypothetical protein